MNHVEVALQKYQNILDMVQKGEGFTYDPKFGTYIALDKGNELFNDLINYMMDNFATPTNAAEGKNVQELFLDSSKIQDLWNSPPTLPEYVIPIAIIRDSAINFKIIFEPKTAWDRFKNVYMDWVLYEKQRMGQKEKKTGWWNPEFRNI